jgi:hypothetical protein
MLVRRLLSEAEVMRLSAADKVWADAVKDREAWTCQRCGARHTVGSRGMNAHHIWTRSRRSTRLSLLNGVALCVGCHRWAHANPLEFHDLARAWLGAEYDALQRLSVSLLKRESIA